MATWYEYDGHKKIWIDFQLQEWKDGDLDFIREMALNMQLTNEY